MKNWKNSTLFCFCFGCLIVGHRPFSPFRPVPKIWKIASKRPQWPSISLGITQKLYSASTYHTLIQALQTLDCFPDIFQFGRLFCRPKHNGRWWQKPLFNRPQSLPSYTWPRLNCNQHQCRCLEIKFAHFLTQKIRSAYLHLSNDFTLFAPFVVCCISANGVGAYIELDWLAQPLVAPKFKMKLRKFFGLFGKKFCTGIF